MGQRIFSAVRLFVATPGSPRNPNFETSSPSGLW
jgi:hypothetical protein